MAAEVIAYIIPNHTTTSGLAPSVDKHKTTRYLAYWMSLTPHPVCPGMFFFFVFVRFLADAYRW